MKRAIYLAAFLFTLALLPPMFGHFYVGIDSIRSDYGYLAEFKRTLFQEVVPWISRYAADEPIFGLPPLGALYPPFWFAALMPTVEWGYSFFVAFHLALAGFGGVLLARSFGIGKQSQTICGIALALSGSTLDLIKHGQSFLISIWLLTGWAAARFGLRQGWRFTSWIGAVLSGTFILLGGDPQSFMVFAGIVALESLSTIRQRQWRCGLGLLSIFLGFMIAWAHWGVAWALLEGSTRRGGMTFEAASVWSHHWISSVAMVMPGLLEVPVFNQFNLGAFTLGLSNLIKGGIATLPQWNMSPFIGAVLLVLGLGIRPRRSQKLVLILAIGFFILAMGKETPLFSFLWRHLPGIGLFRYPQKYLLYSHWCLVLLGVLGWERIRRERQMPKHVFVIGICFVAVGALSALTLWGFGEYIQAKLTDVAILVTRSKEPWVALLSQQLAILALSASATIFAVMYLLNRFISRKWVSYLILTELILALPTNILTGPALVRTAQPWFLSQLTRDDTLCHTGAAFAFFSTSDAPGGWEAEANLWNQMFINGFKAVRGMSALYRIRAAQRYSQLISPESFAAENEVNVGKMSGLLTMGCTHLMAVKSESDLLQARSGLTPIENKLHNPLTEALDLFKVNEPTPIAFELRETGITTASIQSYQRLVGHKIEVSIAPGPGTIVGTRVQYYPGWRVRQLETSSSPPQLMLLRNVLIGAKVSASTAKRTLIFEYTPPHLRSSVLISVFGILLMLLIALNLERIKLFDIRKDK